jgi:Putative DNA-binding domain
MNSRRWNEITLQEIKNFVSTNQEENQRLEFKREVNLETRDSRKEFVTDVCALANTHGGNIIIGVDESNGEASDLPGIALTDADAYKTRIEQILRENLEPKLTGISVKHFMLDESRGVVVIHIPRSSRPPHRAMDGRFYMRANTAKYDVSVEQLRQIFTQGASLNERIRSFVRERIALVTQDFDGPVPYDESHSIVMLHFIPFGALEGSTSVPINRDTQKLLYDISQPFGYWRCASHSFNADGLLWSYAERDFKKDAGYTQVFRNGILEAASSTFVEDNKEQRFLKAGLLETKTEKWFFDSIKVFHQLEIEGPFEFVVSIQNARKIQLRADHDYDFELRHPIGRDLLLLSGIVFDSLDELVSNDQNDEEKLQVIGQHLRPIFDALWQSAGYPESPSNNSRAK